MVKYTLIGVSPSSLYLGTDEGVIIEVDLIPPVHVGDTSVTLSTSSALQYQELFGGTPAKPIFERRQIKLTEFGIAINNTEWANFVGFDKESKTWFVQKVAEKSVPEKMLDAMSLIWDENCYEIGLKETE